MERKEIKYIKKGFINVRWEDTFGYIVDSRLFEESECIATIKRDLSENDFLETSCMMLKSVQK